MQAIVNKNEPPRSPAGEAAATAANGRQGCPASDRHEFVGETASLPRQAAATLPAIQQPPSM
jgi:hypothetical protein